MCSAVLQRLGIQSICLPSASWPHCGALPAGVAVDPAQARYHSSQPWPFPSSLMIGFIAEAAQQAQAHSTGSSGSGAGGPSQPPARGLQLLHGSGLSAALDVGLKPAEAERYLLPQLQAVEVRRLAGMEQQAWPAWICRLLARLASCVPRRPICLAASAA